MCFYKPYTKDAAGEYWNRLCLENKSCPSSLGMIYILQINAAGTFCPHDEVVSTALAHLHLHKLEEQHFYQNYSPNNIATDTEFGLRPEINTGMIFYYMH